MHRIKKEGDKDHYQYQYIVFISPHYGSRCRDKMEFMKHLINQ